MSVRVTLSAGGLPGDSFPGGRSVWDSMWVPLKRRGSAAEVIALSLTLEQHAAEESDVTRDLGPATLQGQDAGEYPKAIWHHAAAITQKTKR